MKKIIYKTETGIAVIHPTQEGLLRFVGDSDVAYDNYEGVSQKDIPRILPFDKQALWNSGKMLLEDYLKFPLPEYKIVDESEIPTDRTFRNAWGYDLKEDIVKSKEIWKNKLRSDREIKFTENDIVLRDAVIENDDTKKNNGIIERDRLRNITDLVDSAKTIDEIKAIAI